MNAPFVSSRPGPWRHGLKSRRPPTTEQRIAALYRRRPGRSPSLAEVQAAARFLTPGDLATGRPRPFSVVPLGAARPGLLMTNELLFVD